MDLFDKQLEAAEHYLKCDRCSRLFRAAPEEALKLAPTQSDAPLRFDDVLLDEFRKCPDWPRGL
jgi:hypothetical protein